MGRQDLAFKPPRQRRSVETLERVLDAAESLIRERGFDNMTIAEVVQRSGSSVGSIYARFNNKIGLLQGVQVRYHTRVRNNLFAAFSGDHPKDESLEEAVVRIVEVMCRLVLSDPQLFRAFVVLAVFDDGVRVRGEQANAERREKVMEILSAHRDEIKHPDAEKAARWTYSMLMAALRERVTYGERAELSGQFSDEDIIAEMTRVATCYLAGEPKGPAFAGV
jgi:AcrR family transcriptional regulator